jgi:hypothetical protein
MKKVLLSLLVLLIGAGTFFVLKPKPVKKVHFHAGFQVYRDDKLVDFSDLKYMHIRPCSDEEKKEKMDAKEEQIDKAHLHDNVPDVVHVHVDGGMWKDLFINLKYDVPSDIVGYSNGQMIRDILNKKIEPYESVVFFIGKNSGIETKLKDRVTKKHIQNVEKNGENC